MARVLFQLQNTHQDRTEGAQVTQRSSKNILFLKCISSIASLLIHVVPDTFLFSVFLGGDAPTVKIGDARPDLCLGRVYALLDGNVMNKVSSCLMSQSTQFDTFPPSPGSCLPGPEAPAAGDRGQGPHRPVRGGFPHAHHQRPPLQERLRGLPHGRVGAGQEALPAPDGPAHGLLPAGGGPGPRAPPQEGPQGQCQPWGRQDQPPGASQPPAGRPEPPIAISAPRPLALRAEGALAPPA